jgi:hypothetical protein
MAVSRWSEGQMPGSGETSPKPVFCAIPTQPDHTSAPAGTARTSSGQDRMVRSARVPAPDRSAAAGPVDRTGEGSPGPASAAESTRSVATVRAAMAITTLP